MRVAITGASGFLGRHLAVALVTRGFTVRLLDAVPPPDGPHPWGLGDIDADFRRVDVADRASLDGAVAGADRVVHLAAISARGACEAQPLAAVRVNVLGTANVLDACVASGVERLVVASSRHAASPRDVYATTKALAETWTLGQGHGVLRFDNVYGPGQPEGAAVSDFVARGYRGLGLRGPAPDERLPLLYVDDAIAALVCVLTAGRPHTRYHACAPAEVPLDGIAAVVAAVVRGLPAPPVGDVVPQTADQALQGLGWSARVEWVEGVRRTCAAWAARLPVPA